MTHPFTIHLTSMWGTVGGPCDRPSPDPRHSGDTLQRALRAVRHGCNPPSKAHDAGAESWSLRVGTLLKHPRSQTESQWVVVRVADSSPPGGDLPPYSAYARPRGSCSHQHAQRPTSPWFVLHLRQVNFLAPDESGRRPGHRGRGIVFFSGVRYFHQFSG